MHIQVKEVRSVFENAQGFNVYRSGDQIGSFDITSLIPTLLHLTTYPRPGRGNSGLVIGAFREQMGHDTQFTAPDVIHYDSWRAIAYLGLVEKVHGQGNLYVNQPEILDQIPITHILKNGGITIDGLELRLRSASQLATIYTDIIRGNDGTRYIDSTIHART